MISRKLVTLAMGAALAASVSACAMLSSWHGDEANAPRACYWLSNQGQGWVAMPHIQTRDECFAADSCSGGLGYSGGGCYKWTRGPDEAQRPW